MKRIAKYLAIAALVLALLLAAGGWVVNRWLQSPGTHANIEGKISDALHLPVKIGSLGFSAWSGITAKKISVTGPDGVIFEAAGLSAGHRFASLLRGNIGLSEVRIEQPHFRMLQDAAGRWAMPHGTASLQPGIATVASAQPNATAPATPPTNAAPIAPLQPQPANTAASSPEKADRIFIGKIIIEGATAELIDKSHAPFATIAGMNVTLRDVTGSAFSGNFFIERVTLNGWFALDHLSGLATQTAQGFQIRELAAEAGGGSVAGEAAWTGGASGSAMLKLDGINLDRAAQNAGATVRKIAGVLGGEVRLTGLGNDAKALGGIGTLSLKGGDCTQFEVLRQIGEALRVAALANFQIADVAANFQIASGQMILGPMEISAPPAGLTLNGPIGFDGALNVAGLLHAPADLVERQGSMLAAKFSPPDARNRRSIPFNITGSLTKPKQNLAESLTGTKDRKQQRIIAVETILSSILEKKNPKLLRQLLPQPAPAPAAAAQP